MSHSRLSFSIRQGLAAVPDLLNRYLSLISIAVLVIGVGLIVLGPIRALAGSPVEAPSPGSDSNSQPQFGSLIADAGSSPLNPVERQLIPFTTIPDRPRRSVVGYTVKPGDTLFGIAGDFGLKPETLFWSNRAELHDDIHLLLPGVTLAILPTDGVYATADGVHTLEQIVKDNNGNLATTINAPYNELSGYQGSDVPFWGKKIAIPGGHRDLISWPAPITTVVVTDRRTGRTSTISGFMQGMGGSCAPGIPGGGGTTSWLVPIVPGDYTVTQPFAPWHSGVDMAAAVGTTVRAADTGVVVFSGWNDWGYGNLVVLDHGNGWSTYYAHLNSRVVGCGDLVQRGGAIGSVGTTGHSTGPHLHFEMRWLNVPDNPARYVGF